MMPADNPEKTPLAKDSAAPTYGIVDKIVHPGDRRSFEIVFACCIICVMEFAEELAEKTFDATQIFFLDRLDMDTDLSSGMQYARDRIFMVCLLICAKLGDNTLGRYETITMGALIYFAGTVMVSLATHPWISRIVWYMVGAFVVLPFSQAAIAANLSNFGADQFDLSIRRHHKSQEQYFYWLNAAYVCGMMFAYIILQLYGIEANDSQYMASSEDWTPVEVSAEPSCYWTVFIATAGVVFVGIMLVMAAKWSYGEKSRSRLPCSGIVGVTQFLINITTGEKSFQGCMILTAKVLGVVIYVAQACLFWVPVLSAPLSVCSAIGVVFSVAGILFFCQDPSWLDNVAQPEDQPLTVQDVKAFLRLLPLIVCSILAYGCLYVMMEIWYGRQACQMDLRLLHADAESPSPQMFKTFFNIVYCLCLLLATPLMLFYVHPWVERKCHEWGLAYRDWTKFLVGLAFAVASALFAAHYEVCRRSSEALPWVVSQCAPEGGMVRSMSGFWMIVPYALMGLSTLHVVPAVAVISYRQVPKTMRSLTVVTGVFMMSASQSLVIAISLAMEEYTPHNLDTGNLEYLYFVGIACSLCFLAFFAWLVRNYEERNFDDTVIRTE